MALTVTLSLSPVECFGLVLLEATVAGSRVVASDIPGALRPLAVRGARQLLSEGLASRGHEVHVVTSAVPGVPAVDRSAGVTVHRIPLLYQKLAPRLGDDAARPFHPPAPDPLFRRLLAEVVREVKPDVIHAHAWSVFSCLARSSQLRQFAEVSCSFSIRTWWYAALS